MTFNEGSAIYVLMTLQMERINCSIHRTYGRNRVASWTGDEEATTTNIREESAKQGRPRVADRRVDRSVGLVRRGSLRFNHALPHAQPRNSERSVSPVEVLRPDVSSILWTDWATSIRNIIAGKTRKLNDSSAGTNNGEFLNEIPLVGIDCTTIRC